MDLFQLIILGIVQGITEWIPISSKTQVTFVYLKVFQGNPSLVIPILLAVHLGTVVAATFYFRNEIAGILSDIAAHPRDFNRQANGKVGFLFTALLFTGIIGIPLLLAEKWFFPMLNGGLLYAVMGGGLIVTGFLLLSHKTGNTREIKDVSWKDGILTGALQGFSILPGISRSGTSTTGLIWQRFDSESSFYLSFLLSIPTVILAEIILNYGSVGLKGLPAYDCIVLFLVSLVVGYLTLDGLLRVVKRVNIAYLVLFLGVLIIAVGLSGFG
ncbi:MAG: undecaprenyl-diphosphate phosphatase [Methanoregula sp.]|uniref:undecaprenyl-diphosphate phosphatase n=1 Tax=Methanoregula sp. TaxID=2052170 RepID=UPI003BB0749A